MIRRYKLKLAWMWIGRWQNRRDEEHRSIATYLLTLLAFLPLPSANAAESRLPVCVPAEVGMSRECLSEIDDVAAKGISEEQMPGCVVLVARHGKIAWLKAYGDSQIQPHRVAMTTDTVFDLASLTKPIATATSVMILVDDGRVSLDDKVAEYIPAFGCDGKEEITVAQLLTHLGGLIPDNSLSDYRDGVDLSRQRIFDLGLRAEPGTRFIYSDVGFIVLAEMVRCISGEDIHRFSKKRIFQPLGMRETGYLPKEALRKRAAPTQRREDHWMVGEVHDPRAYLLGGVAGHAGLFSTAEDLAVYAQMLLDGGERAGRRILKEETVSKMTTGYAIPGGLRGLGWDVKSGYSSNRGEGFSSKAFGHGGFTGTAVWIDPQLDLIVVFLSNRLHPDGEGSVNRLAGRIGSIAADAITTRSK